MLKMAICIVIFGAAYQSIPKPIPAAAAEGIIADLSHTVQNGRLTVGSLGHRIIPVILCLALSDC